MLTTKPEPVQSFAVRVQEIWKLGRKGVDDETPDGPVEYVLEIGPSTSGDSKYNGKNPADIQLTNDDDDPP